MTPGKAGNERDHLKNKLRWHRLVTPVAMAVTMMAISLCAWMVAHQRTFISPPVVQKAYWIASQEASKEYIEDMADYILTSLHTVTPANAEYRIQRVLKLVHPDHYGAISAKLHADIDRLKREGIATVWEPNSVGIADNALCAKWTGNLRRWVGEKPLETLNKTFLVEFDIDRQGTLYVKTADEFTADLAAHSQCQ